MPDIKISELPVASIVNDADIVVLNQGGDTKTAAKSLVVAGLATTDQISGLTNSAQVEALVSAQIAAITPQSIGANAGTEWFDDRAYRNRDIVVYPNSELAYVSQQDDNVNHSPIGDDGTWWKAVSANAVSIAGTLVNSEVGPLPANAALIYSGVYYTPTIIDAAFVGAISTDQESGFATTSQLSGFATTEQLSGYATTAQIEGLTNSAQVEALASAQIAAITPASIGALSTDAASGFATTSQLSGFATTTDIQGIAFTSQLSAFATTDQLSGYATTTDIQGIAFTSQLSGFATTDQISGFTNSAQVEALASAQIAAITPASIGAVATSDIIAITHGGTGSTSAAAALTALGAMSATQAAGGDLSGNLPSPTVAKIQGQAVSAAAPTSGQVLTWNGSAWVATAPASGGSGGGGVLFYFNNATAGGTIPAGAKELGRIAEISQSTITSGTLPTGTWTQIAGFVSDNDPLDPNLEFLPAGIFDFNLWCTGTANINAPTLLRAVVYRWTGSTSIQVGNPSGSAVVANGPTSTQTAISMVIPQTDIDPTDRLYIVLEAQASGSGHTVSIDLGNNTPSHVHTTIPSVGGTGVVKVINGVPQNPASLITDSDVSTAAPLALNKIQMSQVSVSAGAGLTGGGDLSTSRILSLTTTGVSALSYGSSTQVSAFTVDAYGRLTAASDVTISASGIGAQPALTSAAPAAIFQGGTGATTAAAALSALGGVASSALSGYATTGQLSGYATTAQVAGLQPALTSAAPAAIVQGGTGATTAVAALNNLGGITSAALSGYASTSQLAGLQTALTSAAPLAIAQGGTGAITQQGALASLGAAPLVDVMHRSVEYSATSLVTGTMNTSVVPNTFTITATGVYSPDGTTVAVGDIVVFAAQTTVSSAQNGPWQCTTAGAIGVQVVFQRPSWFSGTVKSGIYASVRFGNNRSGFVYSLIGPVGIVDIAVGTAAVTTVIASQRNSNANISTNTFAGRQTFAANTTTVNPFSFQASTTQLSAITPHAVEWDGSQMYVSNLASERLPVATSKALINAQTGTTYTIALADAGYLITASNLGAIAVSIPTDATINFPIGTQILVMQLGAGQVTVSAVTPGTTTIISRSGTKTAGQYALISLIKVAANQWVVGGDATT